jgi:hypothetical protein
MSTQHPQLPCDLGRLAAGFRGEYLGRAEQQPP